MPQNPAVSRGVAVGGSSAYYGQMPAVLRNGSYRFYFYAGDRDELPHVHVARDDREAKFWLDPVRLARSHGFTASESNKVERLTVANQQVLLDG